MDSTVVAAAIAAGVAVLSLISNIIITVRTSNSNAAFQKTMVNINYRTEQLNKFYGPLLLLVRTNKQLAHRIRRGQSDGEQWRLLDELPEILEDPIRGPIAKLIIANDEEIARLIQNFAGYAEGYSGLDSLFSDFLIHFQVLKAAAEGSLTSPDGPYYPRPFTSLVEGHHDSIRSEIKKFSGS